MAVGSNYITGQQGSVTLPGGISGDVEEFSYTADRTQEKTNILGTKYSNSQTVEYGYTGSFVFLIPTTGGTSGIGLIESLDDVLLTMVADASSSDGTLSLNVNITKITVVTKASAVVRYSADFVSKGPPVTS